MFPQPYKLDGFTYPEINLNHRSPDTGKLLIVSVLAEINDATSRSKIFLDMIAGNLPKSKGLQTHVNTPEEWNCFNLVPDAKSFFAYKGSLPRSPCIEDVQWVVFENTINCSTKFFDAIKPILQNNPRQIQKDNGRKIFYNTNTNDKNKRTYGDRLRCYTDQEFRKACSCLTDKKILLRQKKTGIIINGSCYISNLICSPILYLIQENFIGKSYLIYLKHLYFSYQRPSKIII